ncbi:MAG: hypothetical protein ACI4IJ_08860 [Acutalibacteraceae bacterium]
MKFELNNVWAGRIIGIGMAAAVAVTVAIAAEVLDIKQNASAISNDSSAMVEKSENADDDNATIVPFADRSLDDLTGDGGTVQSVYDELRSTEGNKKASTATTASKSTTAPSAASSATSETVVTTTTSAASKPEATTSSTAEPTVSNGKREFNYEDVSGIAAELKTLEDFVTALNPTSFTWDATEYAVDGYVQISLISGYGVVTLDVKPVLPFAGYGEISLENQITGGTSSSSITDWEWYKNNKESGCNICSVTWLAEEFAVAPVRDIKIGTAMTEVIGSYLCVNGGATTLYKASDVITDQNKLNKLLEGENAYTFVGGRVYSIGSYLEKYYYGKENSYRFADCDYVIQYGCNSVMDYDYITGSWIIEYAVKDDVVQGITFMNKSYYAPVNAPSTEDTKSTTSITEFFQKLFGGE